MRISWGSKDVDIEYRWTEPSVQFFASQNNVGPSGAIMVFLHEGLGSTTMWKDFPDRLCAALGMRGLVYSRPGYGASSPRPAEELWDLDFMHQQAHIVLPAVLKALGIDPARQPVYLFGHSDGGSISLLYAARFTTMAAGLIVLAPHIMVEDITVENIEKARLAYMNTDLKERLARYHADPDSAFWGWNRIWLDPRFKDWSIKKELASITCPVLAIQGQDDEYGTMAQIDGIAQQLPETQLLKIPQCGHSPHRDAPALVIDAVKRFVSLAAKTCQ